MDTRQRLGARAPLEWSTFVLARRMDAAAIWRANGVLRDRRGAISRVEVELTIGERDAELILRPASDKPQRWGRRRMRRFFAAAHPAVDALARELTGENDGQLEGTES